MTSSPFPITVTLKHHRHRRPSPPKHYVSAITPNHFMSFRSPSSFSNNLHPSFPFFKRNYRFHRCCATNSPSEPPPENQIPPGNALVWRFFIQSNAMDQGTYFGILDGDLDLRH
ncbi:uncharacterized protein LOC125198388 isoform X2 [Salvia hispanica]|uniref:uncharacterized protein LOC125198388 isoform X2 n=1 Tax=Salvia hispanica TaxID=49212 RepID=UPI002009472F|nr:uncharacterized protein LOC125198388 isoform X2 [Salvia hispanica]